MNWHCQVFLPAGVDGPATSSLRQLPDLLKSHPQGLMRGTYFFSEEHLPNLEALTAAGRLPLWGPLIITHAVRRAVDVLLEGCTYQGLELTVEVSGRTLPELPARPELEKLLQDPATLIHVDGKPFRPTNEVFGYQQVYEDTVRCIDALKKAGVPQETMMIFATPAEISIEVHPGIFGLEPDPRLETAFLAALLEVSSVRVDDRGFHKAAEDRTVIIDGVRRSAQIQVPGSVHPTLHRAKVGVGPSHFAYGPAAFSDFCSKKRTLDECLKETRVWVKALETPIPVIEKVKNWVKPLLDRPIAPATQGRSSAGSGGKSTGGGTTRAATGGFRPLHVEIADHPAAGLAPSMLPAGTPELTKCLGGGWREHGVHVILGSREEGKTSFLVQQMMGLVPHRPVLFVSPELCRDDFLLRVAAWQGRFSRSDLAIRQVGPEPAAQTARQQIAKMCQDAAARLPMLFFRGCESRLDLARLDDLFQIVDMMPVVKGRLLFLSGIDPRPGLADRDWVHHLGELAERHTTTVWLGVHEPPATVARPHLIEGSDLAALAAWQGVAGSVVILQSERTNLKKFLAMSQGKAEPEAVAKLEAHMAQQAGGKKLRNDTFSLVRVLHARGGARQAILFLYQRDCGRFFEGPAVPLGRP
jgi:hypothetical protein